MKQGKFMAIFWLSALFAIFAGLGLHVQAVWHQQLFGDEVHSLFFSRLPWQTLLRAPVEPVHPNGYYLFLKAAYGITPWVTVLRFWQIGLFFVATWLFWKVLGRLHLTGWSRWAGTALWISSAYIWHFSFQLRMYGLGMALMLGSWWSVAEKKRWSLWLSVVLDWLMVGVVYGGSLFVVAKWAGWLLLVRSDHKRLRSSLFAAALSLVPVALVIWQTQIQQVVINQGYLYWVHVPQGSDWSLGLASFMTGLFLPYFEGFSVLGKKWLQLGNTLNVAAVIVLAIAGGWCLSLKKSLQLSESERFLLILTSLSLFLYSGLFFFGVVQGSHYFHIRQIFPVAVVGWVFAAWMLGKLFRRWPLIAFLLWFGMMALNLVAVAADSWGSKQAYPHHFTQLSGTPTYASSADVELIYKQCGVFSHEESTSACQEKGVVILSDKDQFVVPETSSWWMTNSAFSFSADGGNADCVRETADYWFCRQSDKVADDPGK